jgi:hypothetical protein
LLPNSATVWDAEDLGKHVVVAFGEIRERRGRSVEDFLQALVFVRPFLPTAQG